MNFLFQLIFIFKATHSNFTYTIQFFLSITILIDCIFLFNLQDSYPSIQSQIRGFLSFCSTISKLHNLILKPQSLDFIF